MSLTAESPTTVINQTNSYPHNAIADERLTVAFGYDGNLAYNSGVSNYVLTLGNYLTGRGHDVHYFVARTEVDEPNTHVLAKTVNIPSNGSVYPQALPARRKFVEEVFDDVKPDIFHSQLPFQPFVTGHGVHCIGPEVAKVGTFHTLAETTVSKAYTWAMARFIRKSLADFDTTFAATAPLQEQVKHYFDIEPARLALPVNVEKLSSGVKMPEYDDDRVNLVFIGRLDPRKGCQNLLGALSLLNKDTIGQIRLLVAGDGPLRKELQAASYKNGLDNTVTFLGNVTPEEKPDILATSDIAIFPATKSESFGLVIAEALAGTSGIVVGGDNPGYRSVLEDQREALFDPTSPASMSVFIKNLIHNDTLRDKIRSRQQTLVANYDIKTIGPIIEDTYIQSVNKRRRV